jgi:hypothetical protein
MDSPGGAAELQVSESGLRMQAGWCEFLAAGLAGTSAPTRAGSSFLASSAAVDAAHAQIAAAGAGCASRLDATAAKLAMTASDYGENEAGSTAQLYVLGLAAVS